MVLRFCRIDSFTVTFAIDHAFCVMAYVAKAMKNEDKSKEEIDAYYKDAKSSDYNHLLVVSVEMVEKLNAENNSDDSDDLD